MKTTNNAQETGNRKFRVYIAKTFAVVASLVLVSITVSANGFWKQVLVNNSYGKMAILMVNQENGIETLPIYSENNFFASSDSKAISSIFMEEVSNEKALEVESWMTDSRIFGSSILEEEAYSEQPLKIEDWMIDSSKFSFSPDSGEKEPALKVETWMIDQHFWVR